jgi:hypothetical protein
MPVVAVHRSDQLASPRESAQRGRESAGAKVLVVEVIHFETGLRSPLSHPEPLSRIHL